MTDTRDICTSPSTPRRRFLIGSALTGAAPLIARSEPVAAAEPADTSDLRKPTSVDIHVNGRPFHLELDTRLTLLDALREEIGLTGAKKGCDHGQCGACTVLIDGRRELSCLTLAVSAQGRDVVTIEGLDGGGGDLHPMKQAFIDHDAFQCGYCTPGQILSAVSCVREGHAGSPEEIREYMSGNICRCAAYPNIVAAISQASEQMGE
ncbi:xanthine dehydrogenase YagT iron-sulfur-binding subunit [Rhizobium sp. NFR07]|uniref:(2Fe-2S)-binding protein n=1 Tax=Rhizobium sp. NFR07 TaxID=1566262 RepID=UPI0008DFF2BE|nr:(2Fe-2S)-binding protein [Rhizobium sp. NFR07]SFA82280.1 xanthine dehydrogenase YagT iron-sulfur-binding subunit [Rhizobium sp. NFR07]